MADHLSLLAAIDRLYAGVVTDPETWTDQDLGDWVAEVGATGMSRSQARALRRCLRTARRLRDFWAEGKAEVAADDWETRVDLALGARAWRPTLELAMEGLEERPSPELFAEVQQRFRIVNGAPWMDGIDYQSWLEDR